MKIKITCSEIRDYPSLVKSEKYNSGETCQLLFRFFPGPLLEALKQFRAQ